MRGAMQRAARSARHILFPDACLTCNRQVGHHGALCPACWQNVTMIDDPVCAITGLPFTHDLGKGALSADAIANPPHYTKARAAAVHAGTARQLVSRLKYHDQLMLAPLMAQWMVRAGRPFWAEADRIIPVPLHWRRFVGRRYNQAAELARHVAAHTGVALDTQSLCRKRATTPQVGLSATARHANVKGSFDVPDSCRIHIEGRTIVLIDDVYTTGATVNAAAKALKKAKAANVYVLTFSRVLPGATDPLNLPQTSFRERLMRLYQRQPRRENDG